MALLVALQRSGRGRSVRGVLATGVGGGDENRIQGARLGAPGDRDVVSGGFAEAVQFLGDGGVGSRGGGDLGQCIGHG